jgi:hypothetical protein
VATLHHLAEIRGVSPDILDATVTANFAALVGGA